MLLKIILGGGSKLRSRWSGDAAAQCRAMARTMVLGLSLTITCQCALAQAMYRICQQHDQVWREKRRVRELEELRAKSGGVQISGAQSGYGSDAAGVESDAARRLRQAREMLEAKLISDSEFESIKAKIVSGL